MIIPEQGQHSVDTLWYNLMGQPFDNRPTVPGVYVHQGHKVVIR